MTAIVLKDMEITGLDPDPERNLEEALMVTNGELEVVAEGTNLILHQPDEVI